MTREFDERNAAKSRAVCAAMDEAHAAGRRGLTEREKQILEMWPRFEDGEPVWFGDRYRDAAGEPAEVGAVEFGSRRFILAGRDGFRSVFRRGARVRCPAPEVTDADGAPIRVGDTVWANATARGDGREWRVEALDASRGHAVLARDGSGAVRDLRPRWLTHTPPDSWERLEEDAVKEPCDYFGVEYDEDKGCSGCPHLHEGRDCAIALQADLVRRAKRLAGAGERR